MSYLNFCLSKTSIKVLLRHRIEVIGTLRFVKWRRVTLEKMFCRGYSNRRGLNVNNIISSDPSLKCLETHRVRKQSFKNGRIDIRTVEG